MKKNFGLKLWSMDCYYSPELVNQAEIALKDGVFDFLELFPLPDTFDKTKDIIKSKFLGQKVVVHAPHNGQGLDTGNKDEFEKNCWRIKSSQQFADLLNSDIIILHPGANFGDEFVDESIRQFRAINDSRIVVENMPAFCYSSKSNLHGSTPKEIKRFIDELNVGFCFDFSHATCSANYFGLDLYETLSEFYKFNPTMYHLCDGDINSDKDNHLHYGQGNYDLSRLVNEFIADDAIVTMETGVGAPVNITPWVDDVNYIRKLVKG